MTFQEMQQQEKNVNQSIRDMIPSSGLQPGEEQRILSIIDYGGEHLKKIKQDPEAEKYFST